MNNKDYNEEEKEAYGPEDESKFESWWPDIDKEDNDVAVLIEDGEVTEVGYKDALIIWGM